MWDPMLMGTMQRFPWANLHRHTVRGFFQGPAVNSILFGSEKTLRKYLHYSLKGPFEFLWAGKTGKNLDLFAVSTVWDIHPTLSDIG